MHSSPSQYLQTFHIFPHYFKHQNNIHFTFFHATLTFLIFTYPSSYNLFHLLFSPVLTPVEWRLAALSGFPEEFLKSAGANIEGRESCSVTGPEKLHHSGRGRQLPYKFSGKCRRKSGQQLDGLLIHLTRPRRTSGQGWREE